MGRRIVDDPIFHFSHKFYANNRRHLVEYEILEIHFLFQSEIKYKVLKTERSDNYTIIEQNEVILGQEELLDFSKKYKRKEVKNKLKEMINIAREEINSITYRKATLEEILKTWYGYPSKNIDEKNKNEFPMSKVNLIDTQMARRAFSQDER